MKHLFFSGIFFLFTIAGFAQAKKETIESKHQAEIKFEEPQHDFGTIKEGSVVSWEFRFQNVGDTLLILKNVLTSCGCTIVEWPKEPIKPGESASIIVNFDSKGKEGRFNKVVNILSNSSSNSSRITISGTVEKGAAPPLK
jgi:hypothetical protein